MLRVGQQADEEVNRSLCLEWSHKQRLLGFLAQKLFNILRMAEFRVTKLPFLSFLVLLRKRKDELRGFLNNEKNIRSEKHQQRTRKKGCIRT